MNSVRRLTALNLAKLLGDWRVSPVRGLTVGLESRLSLLIAEGRIGFGTHLPPERDLARALGVSRTTIASAYDSLRASGQLESRQGSGTWVTAANSEANENQTPWHPGGTAKDIDLTHAAFPAPQEITSGLIERAARASARYTAGHGYHLYGLPELREAIARRFTERGLPTGAGQVLVTTGAQGALSLALALSLAPGGTVLVEHPTYPHALSAIRQWGGRCVPVEMGSDGWDYDHWREVARRNGPAAMYFVPDFHNPMGLLMSERIRSQLAEICPSSECTMIIDETLVELPMVENLPPPVASFADDTSATITIGSISKVFWGGLRVGWMRASEHVIAKAVTIKAALDMASPVLDQLVAVEVLADLPALIEMRRTNLCAAREMMLHSLAAHLPRWRPLFPSGGLGIWVNIGAQVASRLTEECRSSGLVIAPGVRFGMNGVFEDHVRLPLTLDADIVEDAFSRMTTAWQAVCETGPDISI